MPFKSKAQQGFAHAHPEKFGGAAGLKEWDAATNFKSLPEKAHMDKNLTHGLGTKPKVSPKLKDKRKSGIHSTHIEHLADGSHVAHMSGPGAPDGHSFSAPDMESLAEGLKKHIGQ